MGHELPLSHIKILLILQIRQDQVGKKKHSKILSISHEIMFEKWADTWTQRYNFFTNQGHLMFLQSNEDRDKPPGPMMFYSWVHFYPTSGFTYVLYLCLCDIISLSLAKDSYLLSAHLSLCGDVSKEHWENANLGCFTSSPFCDLDFC